MKRGGIVQGARRFLVGEGWCFVPLHKQRDQVVVNITIDEDVDPTEFERRVVAAVERHRRRN